MQWEVNVVDVYIIILFQLFNTPGTEIAPGSDKVGVDIECDGFGHNFPVVLFSTFFKR